MPSRALRSINGIDRVNSFVLSPDGHFCSNLNPPTRQQSRVDHEQTNFFGRSSLISKEYIALHLLRALILSHSDIL